MQPYSYSSHSNFDRHKSFSVDELNLRDYAHIVVAFKTLDELLGVSNEDCLKACAELKLSVSDFLTIDYLPGKEYCRGVLLEENAAYKTEIKNYRDKVTTYYSAFVIPSNYNCSESTLIKYFLDKICPDIFLHPDFFHDKESSVTETDITLSEFIVKYGDMLLSDARTELNKIPPTKHTVRKSKFSFYQCHGKTENYEIYLETESGTLYIPFSAIKEKDFSLIEQRQKSYFSSYYKNKPEMLEKSLEVLNSPEAILLKQLLSDN